MITKKNDLFIIEMKNTVYILNNGRFLQNVYWGEKINIVDIESMLADKGRSGLSLGMNIEKEEYGFWTSFSFMESCLKVNYPEIRKLDMIFYKHKISEVNGVEKLEITYKNSFSELYATLVYDVYSEFDVIGRYVEVKNEGETVSIENLKSAAIVIPSLDDYRIKHLTGKWAGEFQVNDMKLSIGSFTMQSKRGNTGMDHNPSFALDDGTASEMNGNVWYGLLGYSGSWQITFEKTVFNNVRITGGISNFDFSHELNKGEKVTTPVMYQGYTTKGFGGMSRNLHAFQLKHILPKKSMARVLYNSWEATTFNVNVDNQKELAKKAADMGIELFCIDDGWFGQRNNDRAGLGDWYVNKEKFPNGLEEIISYVKSLGMDFGIWVEPEAVNPDSDLYRQHPDWIYRFKDQEPMQVRNQYSLNISKKEVKEYILGFMSDLLSQNKDITFIKWDMNKSLNDVSEGNTKTDKELWLKHANTVYELWAELRKRFPHVEFEVCSSGGGRVDLGILRYADECWTSDNTDAYDRLFIQEGFSYFYPARIMMGWVTDASSHNHKQYTRPYSYRFHSSMMGSLGVGANLNDLNEEELLEFKKHIALYKEIRNTIQFGKQYRLRSPRLGSTCAVEYVSQDSNEVVLFMFLHGSKCGEGAQHVMLEGLDENSLYKIHSENENLNDKVFHGSTLMKVGVRPLLRGDFDSQMLIFRRVDK